MNRFVNTQGFLMQRAAAGSFQMGGGETEGNPDALPIHKVTLTEDFYISEEPVTAKQFAVYEMEKYGKASKRETHRGFLIGVSYEEAVGYTAWLTEKEGKQYRLPTEAEWEYVARNRDSIPVDRMCDPVIREWCYDWYAPYGEEEVENPAGPRNGIFRCIRGGYLDNPNRYNSFPQAPYYRCALPPAYKRYEEDNENAFGKHPIGFRVVMGKKPYPSGIQPSSFLCVGVRQQTEDYRLAAPDEKTPYFRKRYLLTIPPDNCTAEEIQSAGFSPVFRHHHHSPAFTAAQNGDLMYSVYSTYHEYDAESGLVGARLRLGEDQWDFPDIFLNPVGVNDHASMLHTAPDGKIYHFWGWPQLDHAYPFQYVTSEDNGETWSEVCFPLFKEKAEWVTPQPVNSCINASDGTFYVVSDASANVMVDDTGQQHVGATSVLWRSRDNGKTWENPKARTAGRHTTAVELKDGSILALGGKNTDIDGYMPAAVTCDGGDSYRVFKTPFPALNSGQRPSILRLASGKLVVCGDYQTKKNVKPEAFKDKSGSYVAWSDDEGASWHFKQLWGTQLRKKTPDMFGGATTIGYSVMKQSPDGLIHIICTNVQPLLHLCFNECWLTGEEMPEPPEEELMASGAMRLVTPRREYREYYPSGRIKCCYSGGIADDGRFLLDGQETFWYEDGSVMTDGWYQLGRKVKQFVWYDRAGYPIRRFTYPNTCEEGCEEWYETFWTGSDHVRTKTCFKNRRAEGKAYCYDREGRVTNTVCFHEGKIDSDYSRLEK